MRVLANRTKAQLRWRKQRFIVTATVPSQNYARQTIGFLCRRLLRVVDCVHRKRLKARGGSPCRSGFRIKLLTLILSDVTHGCLSSFIYPPSSALPFQVQTGVGPNSQARVQPCDEVRRMFFSYPLGLDRWVQGILKIICGKNN
jgi:hypothetical protein